VDTKISGIVLKERKIKTENLYIVIPIVTLAIITIIFLVKKAEGKQSQKLPKCATYSMSLAVIGIIFGNSDRWLGYSFMVAGVILAVVDIVRNRSKKIKE